MSTTLSRPAASLALATTLALTGMSTAAPAHAEPVTDPGSAAAGFLAGQITSHGGYLPAPYGGGADLGLTMDAVLALAAAGSSGEVADDATDHIAANLTDYVSYEDAWFLGATAKALLVAVVQDRDPSSFGGHDLLAQVRSMEGESGRFSDSGPYGDSSNMFGQAFALLGLKRAGVNPSTAAVNWTEAQQCDDGGFPTFPGGATCSSDPDSTAIVIQALHATGRGDSSATTRAVDYLAGRQLADGSFGGGQWTPAANTNTTGLVASALRLSGRTTAADRAATWVASVQHGCDMPEPLRGGIAYDASAFESRQAAGDAAEVVDQDRRATAQAILAFAPAGYADATQAVGAVPSVTCGATEPTTTSTSSTSASTTSTSTTSASTTSTSTTSTPSSTGTSTSTTSTSTTSNPSSTSTSATGAPTSTSTSTSAPAVGGGTSPAAPSTPASVETGTWSLAPSSPLPWALGAALLALAGGAALRLRLRHGGVHR